MVLALTFRSFTSTLLPQRTMGMFSQTRTRSPIKGVRASGLTRRGGGGFKRTVPVGDVLVGDAGGDVEHDDAALAVDVVAVAQTAELLLAGSVPDVELDLAEVLRRLALCPTTDWARGNLRW